MMINGEGARANTSEDPFAQKPEASNDSSFDYSSCEESEFERYCSANSVMGTPSLCSSVGTCNDFLDLDFGSGKSSEVGFRERLARLSGDRSVSTSRVFDYLHDRRIEFHNSDANGTGLDVEQHESPNGNVSLHTNTHGDNDSEGLKFLRVERDSSDTPRGEIQNSFDPFDYKESGSPGEEEASSRYEHSDDDDGSMFNYGSEDDGHKMDSYNLRKLQYLQDSKRNNGNPLVIGSSDAFGSDDWDDYIQEIENTKFSSLSLNKHNDQQHQNVERDLDFANTSVGVVTAPNTGRLEQDEMVRIVPSATSLANGKEDPKRFSTGDSMTQRKDILVEKASLKVGLTYRHSDPEKELQCISSEEVVGPDGNYASENDFIVKSKQSNSLFDTTVAQCSSSASIVPCDKEGVDYEDSKVREAHQATEDNFSTHVKEKAKFSPALVNRTVGHLPPIKVGNNEPKDSYDDIVLEMEEILLDSMETPGARFPQSNKSPLPFRDGSSTASTSGTDEAHPLVQHPLRIDKVEVVGAKQKKGDVSLGERLVGVKEYTVYLLRVWSGRDQWEVERRYRDFYTLYRQLKTLYANHGWSLPQPWSRVEQESRKFFGNASPNVVSERSALIQECLISILFSSTPNIAPGTLNWFLSPQKTLSSSSPLATVDTQSTSAYMGGTFTEDGSTFGKTISLLVDIQPAKSVKQLLEAQHYVCAGCHRRLDAGKSLMLEFVQTLGWGKPRLCEYTGQVFCASCHTNETAVIPARVLHLWDFTQYPVSQMAKSYLDSIFDQPMLCVSAVNPHLFSKVPALFQVTSIRRKIGAMVPYVRCPFRRSIQKGVGSRRYLLENNEFFALRDLVDLSKGAFAALPVLVERLSTKILDHITQRCLICCDVGIPCGAKQACEDPSSLIFPFQEDEVKRCKSCKTVFHKPCYKNLLNCPCGVIKNESSEEYKEALARKSDSGSPVKFFSYLFSKKSSKNNPVILMGSLPSTFSDPL